MRETYLSRVGREGGQRRREDIKKTNKKRVVGFITKGDQKK